MKEKSSAFDRPEPDRSGTQLLNNWSQFSSRILALLRNQVVRIFPPKCVLCASELKCSQPTHSIAHPVCCLACWRDQPPIITACFTCALPMASGQTCPDCLKLPKPFTRTVSAYIYREPTSFLIKQFKQAQHFTLGQIYAKVLSERVKQDYDKSVYPDMITAMPLHWHKRLIRGFNQSDVLANTIGNMLHIPVKRTLRKSEKTAEQQSLNRKKRLRNLEDVFDPIVRLDGLHIALVDDVMTTGATAICAADTLLRAGARQVDMWVIARTPLD